MSNTFGYPSCLPCEICGRHINNQSEPRFGYVVCEEHRHVAPNQVHVEKEKLSLSESPQPEYCDCQGFHDGSCHARRIQTLEQLCVDLEEALADKKQFQHFSNNVAAYDHLIANEIDQERIKLLECLRSNYMDDNK